MFVNMNSEIIFAVNLRYASMLSKSQSTNGVVCVCLFIDKLGVSRLPVVKSHGDALGVKMTASKNIASN